MAKTKRKPIGLAVPAKLGSFDLSDANLIVVIIETPLSAWRSLTTLDSCRRPKAAMVIPLDAKERNDRVVAAEKENHSYARVRHIDDLGKQFEKELEEFFVNYHRLGGKTYKFLAVKGPAAAQRVV